MESLHGVYLASLTNDASLTIGVQLHSDRTETTIVVQSSHAQMWTSVRFTRISSCQRSDTRTTETLYDFTLSQAWLVAYRICQAEHHSTACVTINVIQTPHCCYGL